MCIRDSSRTFLCSYYTTIFLTLFAVSKYFCFCFAGTAPAPTYFFSISDRYVLTLPTVLFFKSFNNFTYGGIVEGHEHNEPGMPSLNCIVCFVKSSLQPSGNFKGKLGIMALFFEAFDLPSVSNYLQRN